MRQYARTWLLVMVSAASACTASACAAQTSDTQTSETQERSVAELRLSTRLEREGQVLVLRYRVDNPGPRDAYLLNRVHDQSLQTNPNLVYIDFDRQRRVVNAYKKIPGIPPGMNPTMPATPYVTPVRAGQAVEETVRIPLPVREFDAYAPVPEDGRTVSYAGLTFTVGYYWSVPGMKERSQQIIPGVEVLIPTPPPGTKIEFGELSSATALEIPVWETVK
jgi:hypothetical protein